MAKYRDSKTEVEMFEEENSYVANLVAKKGISPEEGRQKILWSYLTEFGKLAMMHADLVKTMLTLGERIRELADEGVKHPDTTAGDVILKAMIETHKEMEKIYEILNDPKWSEMASEAMGRMAEAMLKEHSNGSNQN